MQVYWQQQRRGQQLVLRSEDGEYQEQLGAVRETRSGFDAFARTFGYDPGRAQKGMPSMEEGKAFVESFRPWELFEGTEGVALDPEVRPQPE